jgi:hypothetical protein
VVRLIRPNDDWQAATFCVKNGAVRCAITLLGTTRWEKPVAQRQHRPLDQPGHGGAE